MYKLDTSFPQIAVSAKHHKVPFFIAAPWTSIDLNIPDGNAIVIEERPSQEMTHIAGVHVAASGEMGKFQTFKMLAQSFTLRVR